MTTTEITGLRVRTAGGDFPLVVGCVDWARIISDKRSIHAIRDDAEAGRIITLPREENSGQHHRIPVARNLEQLGIPFEIVSAP